MDGEKAPRGNRGRRESVKWRRKGIRLIDRNELNIKMGGLIDGGKEEEEE